VWAAALRHVSATAATLADTIDAEVGPRRRVVVAGGWTRMSSVREAKALAMTDVSFSSRRQPGAFGAAIFAAWAAAGGPGTAVDFASEFVHETAGPFRQQSVNPPQGVLL
jgi:sugar (pentulose or hexulose) kinase